MINCRAQSSVFPPAFPRGEKEEKSPFCIFILTFRLFRARVITPSGKLGWVRRPLPFFLTVSLAECLSLCLLPENRDGKILFRQFAQ